MELRSMTVADLDLVRTWLGEPHVARWYLAGSTVDQEIDDLRSCIGGDRPTHPLVVVVNDRPIGWCQWYLCEDYPDYAAGVGSEPGDVGIDYAIGDPSSVGHGVGTELVAALVVHVRQHHPRAGLLADPEAANVVSRRVLEKNGFVLLGVRPVPSEPTPVPMAIYRLPSGESQG